MDWKMGPPVLIGEKVIWPGNARCEPQTGVVKWMGNIPEISPDWTVGLELDEALLEGAFNGFWMGRKLFDCQPNQGLLLPIEEIQKMPSRSNSVQTDTNPPPDFCEQETLHLSGDPPMKETEEGKPKPANTSSHSDLKLDGSQLRGFKVSDLKIKSIKKNKEIQRKHRFSALESKLSEWTLINRTSDRRNASGFEITNKNRDHHTQKFEEILDRISAKQQNLLKAKSGDKKLSLKKKRRKRKLTHETDSKRSSKIEELNISEESENNENLSEAFEKAPTLDSKAYLSNRNMNEVAGYFKEIKEDDALYTKRETGKEINQMLPYNLADPGPGKEKKFFSFLKWFKKTKDEPSLKLGKDSSATSSPMFARRRSSSCESVDTLFSTQTVKSFAFIPPNQYEPSAPPSSLLDFDKSFDENSSLVLSPSKPSSEETESIYEKRKKRRAPQPPRLSRENSLPTTLERKQSEEDLNDGNKSCHRRTVSESFKDKKAGAYSHVQGKKKAPLPPIASIYPNLQKLNNPYPSMNKKKKPAPPPPTSKTNLDSQYSTDQSKEKENSALPSKTQNSEDQKNKNLAVHEANLDSENKRLKINQIPKEISTKDASLSPLPSRPWYKRSHRDSSGSNIIKKDLLKGFERKKNKETEDWMPEVGFSRRSLSTDSTHNKFNIFSRLDKNDDKKKEEKRKSQISILTNISELDREAAEIVRKEQAEEKKMKAENDAKYYSPGFPNSETVKTPIEKHLVPDSSKTSSEPYLQKDEIKKDIQNSLKEEGFKPKTTNKEQNLKITENIFEKLEPKDKEENIANKKSLSNQSNEKARHISPNILTDVTNSDSKTSNKSSEPNQTNLNYFKVETKELNYLNEPWVCQKCTLENPGWRVFCEICSSVKPRFLFNPKQKTEIHKVPETTINSKTEIVTTPPNTQNVESTQSPQKTFVEEDMGNSNINFEILEDLRKKRMAFFTPKSENASEKNIGETVLLAEDKENGNIKNRESSLPKTSPEKESVILDKANKVTENAKLEKTQIQKKKSPSKEKISPVKEEVMYGAIKKKQSPRIKKEEEKVAEAYVITKTIVLEDIIVKKADKGAKVSTSVQTAKNEPEPGTSGIRPPPRTKKNVDIYPEKAHSSKKTFDGILDLTNTDEKVLNYTQKDLEELTLKLTRAEGLADFKANIETMPFNTEMNTVAVNRLLRRLETAINSGDHFVAAGLAKELALMNINCSVTRQVVNPPASTSFSKITIDMYVEDKLSHQGPIPIQVSPSMTLLQLKKKVQQKLGIPTNVQRWILGKKLATDDNKTLESDGVKTDSCAVFLYLVAPDKKQEADKPENVMESVKDNQQKEADLGHKSDGWYYNYEEDHYSFCEDSEDDSPQTNLKPELKTQETPPPEPDNVSKIPQSDLRIQSENIRRPSVVDVKSVEVENEVEKELKLITVNSVKQKVEQLNKTFAENNQPMRKNPRSSLSPENWKCASCTFVNPSAKLNCSACSAKKVASRFGISGKETKLQPSAKEIEKRDKVINGNFHYKELIELQDADLVPNAEPFNCSVCMTDYSPGEGVTLKDCLHTFCRTCLISTVQFSEDAEVKCPYLDDKYSCTSVLQQREIKALVPRKIFELHLAKSVKEAENKIGNAFHCKTPDCKGWCIYEDNVNEFHCPVCKFTNCLTCQAIHSGINCREYQERMKNASETNADAKKTREMLEDMVEKGEAMACPKCQIVLMKKWGCDWLRCSMCKTEICWVTRGFRWGPRGKGDTSGGCRCGINGIKCHPKCNYCH